MNIDDCQQQEESKAKIGQVMVEQFPVFLNYTQSIRRKFIKENNREKQKFMKPPVKARFQVKNTKGAKTELLVKHVIPRGIFVYPLKEYGRSDDKFTLDYFPPIESLSKHEQVVDSVKVFLDEWFEDYPHNKDSSETISNNYFILWTFFKVLQVIEQPINILEISNTIGELISKNGAVVYSVLSYHLNPLLHTIKQQKFSKWLPSLISNYRKLYCTICFKYLCKLHFFKHMKFLDEDREEFPIGFNKRIKKTTLQKKWADKPPLGNVPQSTAPQIIKDYKCKNRTNCIKSKGGDFVYQGESNIMENFSNPAYLYTTVLLNNIFTNSCVICSILSSPVYDNVTCCLIHKFCDSLNQKSVSGLREVESYLNKKYSFITTGSISNPYPADKRISLKNEIFNYSDFFKKSNSSGNLSTSFVVPTKERALKSGCEKPINIKQNENYEFKPCMHVGQCNEDNCFCIKSR